MNPHCFFYRRFIDPLLRPLRRTLAGMIPEGASVLEAACGTGEQSLIIARKAGRVLGFDYNRTIVECAQGRIPGDGEWTNLTFQEADARDLLFIADGEFDYATITLALHEMNPANRIPVLRELSRTARQLLVADYSTPMPSTIGGWFTRMIEKMAGKDHYAGYSDYQAAGGLDTIIRESGLEIVEENSVLGGIGRIVLCRVIDSESPSALQPNKALPSQEQKLPVPQDR